MKLTIIPDIVFRGTTIDYGDFDGAGNRGRRETRTFRLIPETGITIKVNVNSSQSVADIIRKRLIEIVKDAIQAGMDNDISIFTGDSNSPPIVIKRPRNWGNSEVQDLFAQKNTIATFNIIKRDGRVLNNKFGKERVWYLNAPQLNNPIIWVIRMDLRK